MGETYSINLQNM